MYFTISLAIAAMRSAGLVLVRTFVYAVAAAAGSRFASSGSELSGSAWLDEVLDIGADYKGTFGYTKKKAFVHKSPYLTTSVGVLVRQLLGQSKGVQEGVSQIAERLPTWEAGKVNFYYWYYATLALFQAGGENWTRWNVAMTFSAAGAARHLEVGLGILRGLAADDRRFVWRAAASAMRTLGKRHPERVRAELQTWLDDAARRAPAEVALKGMG